MNESPTEGAVATPASQEPTGQEAVVTTAESQNQETISQETVSQDTANQTNTQTSGGQNDDDGLAKFAKSQGFDPENLSDGERRALKIAHDNQKAYRSTSNEKKVTEAASELHTPVANETEDAKFRREFQTWKYEQQAEKFWADKQDRTLEPSMVEILNEKKEQYGTEYARILSQDLNTLYDLARLKSGAQVGAPVDADAIRREERESIKRQANASAGQPHAVSQATSETKIDRNWLDTQYQPSNPEHRKLVDAAYARGDL